MMGCAEPIIASGQTLFDEGRCRPATRTLSKPVFTEPENQEAKVPLADAFERMRTG